MLYSFPLLGQHFRLALQVRKLGGQALQSLLIGIGCILAQQCSLFDFQLHNLSVDSFQLFWLAVRTYTNMAGRFIDYIYRFIRQKAFIDISVRQLGCRNKRIICYADAVMKFIFFFQSPEDKNCIIYGWLANKYRLEPSCKSGISFNIFTVLIQCCRTNTM